MKSRHAAALASIDAKAVIFGASLGLLVPFGVILVGHFYPSIGNRMICLWPSVVLLVVFGSEPVANMRLLFAISVGVNVVLDVTLCWFVVILFDTVKRLSS